MGKEVVSDSSFIIFLAKLDIFYLAKNIFSRIILPREVVKELFAKDFPESEVIKRQIDRFLYSRDVIEIKNFPLDEGEKVAISMCLEKGIKTLLSDDKKARVYARNLGIEVIGILGILLFNLKKNKISKKEFLSLLNKLIEKGYYITPILYSEIMKKLEETN